MFMRKSWKLETTGVDGNVMLFGVNIFDYQWNDTGERAAVPDLSYEASVYWVKIHGIVYRFAAGERSNCVWNFYLFK